MLVFWTARLGRQSSRFYSIAVAPHYLYRRRGLETLDPSKFEEKGQKPMYLSTPKKNGSAVEFSQNDPLQQRGSQLTFQEGGTNAGESSRALGYFYFRPAELHQPATAAGVRFRLAASPEAFATGEDLKLPNGEPWSRPLFTLITSLRGRPLYNKLVEEGLVSEEVVRSLTDLASSEGFGTLTYGFCRGSTILYNLSDPFTLDLSTTYHAFIALTDSAFDQAKWPDLFLDRSRNASKNGRAVYKGTVRLRFEPSTLPQHAGTRTVVVRILDAVHPVENVDPNYDGWVPKPQVGELVTKPECWHGHIPFSFDLDAPQSLRTAAGRLTKLLRLLWENDPLLGHSALPTASVTPPPTKIHPVIFPIEGRTRVVNTLDPAKFLQKGQPAIDISGLPTLRVKGPDTYRRTMLTGYHHDDDDVKKERLYPANTLGYLYFQPGEANHPRISGRVRFRLASTLEEFATGEDLKRPDGTVWQISLLFLAKTPGYRALFDQIVEDNLVPQDFQRSVDAMLSREGEFPRPSNKAVIHTLSDPFPLDISLCRPWLWAITDERCLQSAWTPGFVVKNPTGTASWQKIPLFQGNIRVRFEPSTLPEHAGTRTIVVRVLDILEPIQRLALYYHGDIPAPQVGELLIGKVGHRIGVISFDIDGKRGTPAFRTLLRHLWDGDVKRGILTDPRATISS